jgi:hypothetical protein
MDNNIPKIELDELGVEPAFYIAKKCLDCEVATGESGVRVLEDVQLPTLESAVAMIRGFTEVTIKKHPNAKYEDGILYITDPEGDSHRYIQAVITGNPIVVWQSAEADNISSKFNDIINGIDLDN